MSSSTKPWFTEEEIERLKKNPNVRKIYYDKSENRVHLRYTADFRKGLASTIAAKESPTAFFRSAGLPPSLIGEKRIERATAYCHKLVQAKQEAANA